MTPSANLDITISNKMFSLSVVKNDAAREAVRTPSLLHIPQCVEIDRPIKRIGLNNTKRDFRRRPDIVTCTVHFSKLMADSCTNFCIDHGTSENRVSTRIELKLGWHMKMSNRSCISVLKISRD